MLIWKMDRGCLAGWEHRSKHIDYALTLGLPEFFPSDETRDEQIILCASGPSLRTELHTVRQGVDAGCHLMAVNKAHDFLIDRGIVPDYGISIDPQVNTYKDFSEEVDIQYFLASQCHPNFFDHLKDKRVTLFHLGAKSEKEHLKRHRCYLMGGGSTSGLRAITLAYLMGYRKLHLVGYDSCYMYGQRNVNRPVDKTMLKIEVNEKDFFTNTEFAAQADEFQAILETLVGAKLRVYGDGMIAEIMKARKQYLACEFAA